MGRSYQTILAAGTLTDVRAAITESGQDAAVLPAGPDRWAVVPRDEDGYAETRDLALLLSRGSVSATFDVFDSEVLAVGIFRDGRWAHDYLSDQSFADTLQDDDDNEILVDFLGREYPAGATLPTGAYGADPAAFLPLATAEVDEAALTKALSIEQRMADRRHHDILHLLHIDPGPLQMTYPDARA
ncbi:hypothetical protein [Actinoplanes sp. NPDC051494]|uniref:hypothetical protein n=1 Tax=Actinoplanes sp. NPDC051494 TaxID=3363907 RepID=UPI0037BC5B2F